MQGNGIKNFGTFNPKKWCGCHKKLRKQLAQPIFCCTFAAVFSAHDELKKAYPISQDFKRWYCRKDDERSTAQIHAALHQWYGQARQVAAFEGVVKMVRKHETEIVNFFQHGLTNAKAENLNGKMQRFVSNNYGIKDKDFFLYRTVHYFS
jgi:transposase